MARAWLGLGANIGDPPAQVREAVRRLDATPGIQVVAQSSMLLTKPWGKTDQPDFSNMVIEVETELAPLRAARGVPRDRAGDGTGPRRPLGPAAHRYRRGGLRAAACSPTTACTCRTPTRMSGTSCWSRCARLRRRWRSGSWGGGGRHLRSRWGLPYLTPHYLQHPHGRVEILAAFFAALRGFLDFAPEADVVVFVDMGALPDLVGGHQVFAERDGE